LFKRENGKHSTSVLFECDAQLNCAAAEQPAIARDDVAFDAIRTIARLRVDLRDERNIAHQCNDLLFRVFDSLLVSVLSKRSPAYRFHLGFNSRIHRQKSC
jgi:hypothetical protein